jgi:hypothetical protein
MKKGQHVIQEPGYTKEELRANLYPTKHWFGPSSPLFQKKKKALCHFEHIFPDEIK